MDSLNFVLPQATTASTETPARGLIRSSAPISKVSGTRAGRVSVSRTPNCRAIS